MIRIIITLILISCTVAHAEDSLWKNNKLTPAQPFPGRILAVDVGWGGYRLVIESIGEAEILYCIATVVPKGDSQLLYKVIQKIDLPKPSNATVYLNPAVDIDRFSWSIGPWKIGRIFGDDDSVKQAITLTPVRKSP